MSSTVKLNDRHRIYTLLCFFVLCWFNFVLCCADFMLCCVALILCCVVLCRFYVMLILCCVVLCWFYVVLCCAEFMLCALSFSAIVLKIEYSIKIEIWEHTQKEEEREGRRWRREPLQEEGETTTHTGRGEREKW